MTTTKKVRKRPSETECRAMLNSIADALFVIGGKWKLKTIVALMEGSKRFNELQRLVTGISSKVLATELKELELNGFVKRKVITASPVGVEYELTQYAESLDVVLDALSTWGATHRAKIRRSISEKS